MAAKKVKLLLNKSVENLGIVGDIVKVRPGFARNYLLPHALAETPTPTKIERLKEAREAALAELARLASLITAVHWADAKQSQDCEGISRLAPR